MTKEGPIVHYLINSLDVEDKFKIYDTAYLTDVAILSNTQMVLKWIGNEDKPTITVPYRRAFFLKTDISKSYFVGFRNVNECYITEFNEHYRKDDYLYYSKHIDGKLIECGGVKGDEFVPFKQFEENDIMTEYIYGYNNETGNIDVGTKTEVYHGSYMNNPRKHYPRSREELTTVNPKPSTKPEPAAKAITTDFIRNPPVESIRGRKERPSVSAENPKPTTNTQLIVEGDEWVFSIGDKIQENTQYRASTLQFKEYYQDRSLTTLQINMLNFPYLKLLIFGNYVQNGVKGELLEINGCALLESIKFGMRSFTNYQRYAFTSMICYCIVNRFTKIEINRNDSFGNDRKY